LIKNDVSFNTVVHDYNLSVLNNSNTNNLAIINMPERMNT